jgi:hypothetical protein
MAAAQQNYSIELGQSLASVLTIALNGVPIPSTAATALDSNQVYPVSQPELPSWVAIVL